MQTMTFPIKSWIVFIVDIFYFEISILPRRRVRIVETCKILSFLSKISSYLVVNSNLNICMLVSVFCVLYGFKT
jgi:hypothetical protein